MKNVIQFSNYRDFLRHYYETRKRDEGMTYRDFAKAAGLNSPNYLQLVIAGSKNLTVANIHAFASVMGLGEKDHAYFEALVLRDQAKRLSERRFYEGRLKGLKKEILPSRSKGKMKFLVREWYFPALVLLFDGTEDSRLETRINEASERLKLPPDAIRAAFHELSSSGSLELKNGVWSLESRHLYAFDRKSAQVAHYEFLRSQLRLSAQELEMNYGGGARFYSHTLRLSQEAVLVVNTKYQRFLEEMTLLSESYPGDEILQMNSQVFVVGRPQIPPTYDVYSVPSLGR